MKSSKPLLSNKIEDINSKLNENELNNFTADCLKKYCKENSIPHATTKANIIINLLEHFNNHNNINNGNKQPLNDSSNIQQPKMKSILKKENLQENKEKDIENKENINEIIVEVEKLKINDKNSNVGMTTRRKALEKKKQDVKEQDEKEQDISNNGKKKVTFNSVDQIGFIERKKRNEIKYYINTNQNSPMKNESPIKITNNQSYSIFDFIEREEEEFDTETMQKWELKEALEINGLPTDGDKKQLKERLEKFIIQTLNKDDIDNKDDSIDEDWVRWTPLKAKHNKSSTQSLKDSSKTKKSIKSKPKPSKKSKNNSDDGDDDDDDDDDQSDGSYDDDISSQQLFNAFIDVSSNKKK